MWRHFGWLKQERKDSERESENGKFILDIVTREASIKMRQVNHSVEAVVEKPRAKETVESLLRMAGEGHQTKLARWTKSRDALAEAPCILTHLNTVTARKSHKCAHGKEAGEPHTILRWL